MRNREDLWLTAPAAGSDQRKPKKRTELEGDWMQSPVQTFSWERNELNLSVGAV